MSAAKTSRGIARSDLFPNFYKADILTSSADTAKAIEWVTGFSIKDGYGFVIHKIEWVIAAASLVVANMKDEADAVYCALAVRNDLTVTQIQSGILDSIIDAEWHQLHVASAVGYNLLENKFIHDFTNEPGGGRLVAPKPLYFNVGSTGLGVAGAGYSVKVVYTMIKLSEQVYRELYESMNPSA